MLASEDCNYIQLRALTHLTEAISDNAVTKQIAVLRSNISKLEDSESKLLQQLEELRVNLGQLRSEKAVLESKIAPIWCLPTEMLSYIFELGAEMEIQQEINDEETGKSGNEEKEEKDHETGCACGESHTHSPSFRTASDGTDETEDKKPKVPFAVLVSHVCRTFREVATHTPSLWSRIMLNGIRTQELDRARTFIARSGSVSLTIIYDEEDADYLLHLEEVGHFMDIVAPHISRLKGLTLQLPYFQALHRIMQRLDKPAPLLETLELCERDYETGFDEFEDFRSMDLRDPLVIFQGNMPKLKRLVLDGVHVSWTGCNFHGLEEIVLGYHTHDVRPTYEEFKAIIDASPDLQLLDLRGSGPTLTDDAALAACFPVIEMEHLESLHLSDISSEYSAPFVSLLRAPHLQSLSLANLDTNDYSAFLLRLASRPVLFPTVTALKLYSVQSNEVSYLKLLLAYPNLKKLTLYIDHENTHWLTALVPDDPTQEVPCPKLETLKCVRTALADIKDVLDKRRTRGHAIPNLQIDHETEGMGSIDLMKWIKENTAVEIVEPSEASVEDEDDDDSEWGTSEGSQGIGLPWYLDADDDLDGMTDDDDTEEDSDMDVDDEDDSDDSDEED
ncbi:hypothetical protein M422DRAFT_64271 [Sphaerobolus stellatus SS14]|nr:hypothetical protein M422DRAFT_64271 [Sphaerobolus stellatus SS14]